MANIDKLMGRFKGTNKQISEALALPLVSETLDGIIKLPGVKRARITGITDKYVTYDNKIKDNPCLELCCDYDNDGVWQMVSRNIDYNGHWADSWNWDVYARHKEKKEVISYLYDYAGFSGLLAIEGKIKEVVGEHMGHYLSIEWGGKSEEVKSRSRLKSQILKSQIDSYCFSHCDLLYPLFRKGHYWMKVVFSNKVYLNMKGPESADDLFELKSKYDMWCDKQDRDKRIGELEKKVKELESKSHQHSYLVRRSDSPLNCM